MTMIRQAAKRRPASTTAGIAALAMILTCSGLASAAPTATYHSGDVEVSVGTTFDGPTLHGYADYPVTIGNTSADNTYEVTIFLPATSGGAYSADRLASVSQTVTLAPGGEAKLGLLQPPLPVYGKGIGVRINGRPQKPLTSRSFEHASNRFGMAYGGAVNPPALLICKPLNDTEIGDTYDAMFGTAASGIVGSPGVNRLFTRSQIEPETWPETWLAYARYDGVMIRPDEYRKLSDGARVALRTYVEAGGTLIIVGSGWQPPTEWASERTGATGDVSNYQPRLGRVCVVEQTDPRQWDRGVWNNLRQALSNSSKPWNKWYDVQEANEKFPVVEELGVPVRGLFLLMLIFALLIGPVNLFVLTRMKRKIWMLWTVPAISLIACGAVFAYNLLAEGFTGSTRSQVITVLDQTNHRAATIGWTAFYSPLTPGDGLHFSPDTEVTPLIGGAHGDSGRARTVDWTHDQHLDTGWVTARVPAHFMIRKPAAARERLDFNSVGTSVVVTNGLGVDITRLVYMDKSGKLHEVGAVPAGQKMTLAAATTTTTIGRGVDLRQVFASADWLETCKRMIERPEAFLRPGSYIAIVPRSPFIENALPGTDEWQTDSVVYGLTE